jgi:hypothetical protein
MRLQLIFGIPGGWGCIQNLLVKRGRPADTMEVWNKHWIQTGGPQMECSTEKIEVLVEKLARALADEVGDAEGTNLLEAV